MILVYLTRQKGSGSVEVTSVATNAFVATWEVIGFSIYDGIQTFLAYQCGIGLLFIPLVAIAIPIAVKMQDLGFYSFAVFVYGFSCPSDAFARDRLIRWRLSRMRFWLEEREVSCWR